MTTADGRAGRTGLATTNARTILGYLVVVILAVGAVALVDATIDTITGYLAATPGTPLARVLVDGRGSMVALCLLYLLVVVLTGRGLIAAPNYRLLDRSLRECRARTRILFEAGEANAYRQHVRETIDGEMVRLRHPGEVASWVPWFDWVLAIPLTKLAAGWRAFHSAERRLVHLVGDEDLPEYGANIIAELQEFDDDESAVLEVRLERAAASPSRMRTLIEYAHYRVNLREETTQEAHFERQRTALWLASIGLIGIVVVGFAFDGLRVSLLVGALGGFLAPAIAAMQGSTKEGSLAVTVLSPVGGALAAAGGLFLLRLLSDVGVLGEFFAFASPQDYRSGVGLAAALLLGFSGKLFSEIAITAAGHLSAPDDTARSAPVGAGT